MEGERNLGGQGHIAKGIVPPGAVGLHCRIRPFVPRSEVDRVRVDWFTAG